MKRKTAKGDSSPSGKRPKPIAPQIILGSGSPRRRELLGYTGLNFRVEAPDIDEAIRARESPRRYVKRIAKEKAERIAEIHSQHSSSKEVIIITADTTVVVSSKILGKPLSPADACRMLKSMQGRWHEVFTAVCVMTTKRQVLFIVRTKVKLATMSEAAIKRYVRSGEPLDKAGSYGAQGSGMRFVERISGSYSNVIGLPMVELVHCLERDFDVVLPS